MYLDPELQQAVIKQLRLSVEVDFTELYRELLPSHLHRHRQCVPDQDQGTREREYSLICNILNAIFSPIASTNQSWKKIAAALGSPQGEIEPSSSSHRQIFLQNVRILQCISIFFTILYGYSGKWEHEIAKAILPSTICPLKKQNSSSWVERVTSYAAA